MNTALETKVDYALTGYTLQGTPVTGADQPSVQAPLLAPGQYTDTLADADKSLTDSSGTIKYYTVPVKPGVRLYVSVTIVPPDTSATEIQGFGTDADLLRDDLTSCSNDYGRNVEVVYPEVQQSVTTVLAQDIGGPRYGKCPQQGVLILQIQRLGMAYQGIAAPIEIAIRSEPAADASAVAPPAEKQTALDAPVHGTAGPITGGDSFNNAPEITSGVTYSDTIVTGGSRYFRIPLQWGQRFSYLLTPAGNAQPELQIGSHVSVAAFNPVRQDIAMSDYDNGGEFWFNSGPPNPLTASSVYPARYTNRQEFASGSYSLDGDYYLRLMAPLADTPSSEGYLLTVLVSGDPEPGPTYQLAGVAATSTVSNEAGSVASNSSGSVTSAAASSTADSGAAITSQNAANDSEPAGTNSWLYVAIGAAVLLAAVIVATVLRRRKSATVPPTHS